MLFPIKKLLLLPWYILLLLFIQLSSALLFAGPAGNSNYPSILKKAGDRYLMKSKPDSALYFYKKALLLMQDDKYNDDKAMLLTNMANAWHYLDKLNEALDCSMQSNAIYAELHDTSGLARSGCDIGLYYYELSDRTAAFSWLTKSLKYAEIANDAMAIGKANSYLAVLYLEIDENVERAQEYLLKAEALFSKLDEPSWLNHVKNELAITYKRQGNFKEAIKIGEELQRWCAAHERTYEEAVVLHNLGLVYTEMKDYQSSINYYNRAIEKFKEIGDSVWIADEYYSIGLDLIADKKYKEAIINLQVGLGMVQALGDLETESKIAEALEDVFEKTGNFEDALRFNKRFLLLKDSMYSKEQNKKLAELKTKFETEKKDKEIVLLNKDKQIQSAEAIKQRQLKNLFIGGILVLLIFSILLYNRYQLKKRSAKLLAEKNILIQKEKEKAELSEKYKQDFLANMSHEIRTPMNAIIGLTNLLSDHVHDKQPVVYLDAIKHSSQNLLHIINDILDLSRLEAGKMTLEKKVFNVRRTCEMLITAFTALAADKKLYLTFDQITSTDFYTGDEGKLTQVLTNLIGNAIKFTEQGGVKLVIKEEEKNGNQVLLSFAVEDTGIGISAENKAHIFESFRQAQTGQSRNYGGTGLGLTISKKLVEAQGGKLYVESTPGKGSVFGFSICYDLSTEAEISKLHSGNEAAYHGRVFQGSVSILLAEDNVYNQLVAVDTLKKYFTDAKINIAVNGVEVLSFLENQQTDLIFMDVQMPIMDGFVTTEKIRKHASPEVRLIPVIGLTASVIRSDLDKCIQAGMNAYIPKPFKEEELIEAVFKYSNRNFTPVHTDEKTVAVNDEELKYKELFLKLVPQRLVIIEKALPKGDWKTIRDTIHLMRPQLVAAGMADRETFFESFDAMDGSIPFTEWMSKTKLFCILVRKKMEEMQQV